MPPMNRRRLPQQPGQVPGQAQVGQRPQINVAPPQQSRPLVRPAQVGQTLGGRTTAASPMAAPAARAPSGLAGGAMPVPGGVRTALPPLPGRGGAGAAPAAPAGGAGSSTLGASLDANYQKLLDANMAMAGKIQDIGQANIAALQRRNGTLAAQSGRSIGGGYLGGQRSMLTQGLGQLNKDLLANDAARQNIMQQQLRDQMNLATRAEDRALFEQDRATEWEREDTKEAATAKAEEEKSKRTATADHIRNAYKQAFGSLEGGHKWIEKNIEEYMRTGDPTVLNAIWEEIDNANRDAESAEPQNATQAAQTFGYAMDSTPTETPKPKSQAEADQMAQSNLYRRLRGR